MKQAGRRRACGRTSGAGRMGGSCGSTLGWAMSLRSVPASTERDCFKVLLNCANCELFTRGLTRPEMQQKQQLSCCLSRPDGQTTFAEACYPCNTSRRAEVQCSRSAVPFTVTLVSHARVPADPWQTHQTAITLTETHETRLNSMSSSVQKTTIKSRKRNHTRQI